MDAGEDAIAAVLPAVMREAQIPVLTTEMDTITAITQAIRMAIMRESLTVSCLSMVLPLEMDAAAIQEPLPAPLPIMTHPPMDANANSDVNDLTFKLQSLN